MLEENCKKCNGHGKTLYANTSTYRNTIGGARMTMDVCDVCWGSGDENQPFTNILDLYDQLKNAKIESATKEIFYHKMGCWLPKLNESMRELVADLIVLSKKRSKSNDYQKMAGLLTDTILKMIAITKEE